MMLSMSSGLRRRDLRPCTFMMVQNEHWNGQPRPASKLVMVPTVRRTNSLGRHDGCDGGDEHLGLAHLGRERMDASQRIRWHGRAMPADDISVVIVVRRLDEYDGKLARRGGAPSSHGGRGRIHASDHIRFQC